MYLNDNAITTLLQGEPGSHDHGPTMLFRMLDCARKVRLDAEQPNTGLPAFELCVGTLTHKLVELYHKGEDPARLVAAKVNHPAIDPMLELAWKLYHHYARGFPLGFWGNLVAAEVDLERDGPHGKETGKLDAVWRMGTDDIDRVQQRFGIRLPGEGVYGWDLKTAAQRDNSLADKYIVDPQPYRYTHLLREAGYDPVGFIVFCAIKYKTDRQDHYQAVCLPTDTLLTTDNAKRMDAIMRAAKAAKAADEARPSNCMNRGKLCSHYSSGACLGY